MFRIYYRIESAPGDGEPFQVTVDLGDRAGLQVIPLQSTRPHFGGSRWWFACPGCKKRCKKLYMPPGKCEFGCRLCHNLTYISSQTAHTLSGDRAVQSVRKYRVDLMKRLYGEEIAIDWETPPATE